MDNISRESIYKVYSQKVNEFHNNEQKGCGENVNKAPETKEVDSRFARDLAAIERIIDGDVMQRALLCGTCKFNKEFGLFFVTADASATVVRLSEVLNQYVQQLIDRANGLPETDAAPNIRKIVEDMTIGEMGAENE